MGFLDIFRPKWRHSDPAIRMAAVKELGDEEMSTIERVLREDPEASIRRVALKRVSDTQLLLQLADADPDESLRKNAADRAQQLLLDRALRGQDASQSLSALEQLRSTRALIDVAKKAVEQAVREAALLRITEQKALGELARSADDPHIRHQATERLTDPGALRDVALLDDAKDIALLATNKIGDKKVLAEIQKRARQKAARVRAEEKLASESRDAEALAALPPEKAQQEDLCRRAERLGEIEDLAELQLKLEELRDEWVHLVSQPERQYAERFERARGKQQQRLDKVAKKSAKAALPPPPPVPTLVAAPVARALPRPEPTAALAAPAAPVVEQLLPREPTADELALREKDLEFLGTLVAQVEELRGETRNRGKRLASLVPKVESLARRARVGADDPLLQRFADARGQIEAQESELRRIEAEQEAQASERAKQAIGELEALAGSEDRKRADVALREAKIAFEALGDRAPLRNRYEQARELVSRRIAELREAEDWRRWSNVPLLEALCVKMEALAGEEDLAKLAESVKLLQAEWKKVGAAPKEKSELLWQRFKKAADEQYARCKGLFAARDEARGEILKKLEELCVRVEGLAQATEFKETAEKIKAAQAEWKEAGPAPRKEQEVLWKRFRAACDGFFERRKAFFAERDANREENQQRLEQLCARAEKLATSSDWRATSDALKELQAEWKEAGPAPKDAQEALWQRFRTACDAFFARRKEHFEKLDEASAGNLVKKQEIVDRAQKLMDEVDVEKAREAWHNLLGEWKASGHAPKAQADELWNKFRQVGNAIRDGRIGYKPEDLVLPEVDPSYKFEHKAFAGLASLAEGGAEGGAEAGEAKRPAPAPRAKPAPAVNPYTPVAAPPAVERRQVAAPVQTAAPEQVTAPVKIEAAPVPMTIHDQVTAPSKIEAAPAPVPVTKVEPPAPTPAPEVATPVVSPADEGWD